MTRIIINIITHHEHTLKMTHSTISNLPAMNIFILSLNPKRCAKYYYDKHVHKIITEIAQMMSTAIRLVLKHKYYDSDKIFKITHVNHPVSVWLRSSNGNWNWTMQLAQELHKEWKYRYGHSQDRIHKSYAKIIYIKKLVRKYDITFGPSTITPFVQAMPNEYKGDDAVKAYREYYMYDKRNIASWKNREPAYWWE